MIKKLSNPQTPNINLVPKIITDLDEDQEHEQEQDVGKQQKKHQHRNKVQLKKYSANFNRSKSAEKDTSYKGSENSYLKVLINTKDGQIEKLIQKVTDLHNYNEEFALANDRLQSQVQLLTQQNENLSTVLQQSENKTCIICSEWSVEKENMLKTNKTLKEDITMFKILVYRLNIQVERYQDKIRNLNIEINDDKSNATECSAKELDSLNWGHINTHTLGPLLNSYDEIIKEKEDLINQFECEINRFTGNLKQILVENERIQKEINEIRKGKDGWREERTRLQAQLDICRTKAELQTRRGDIAREKLVEVLRCYEQKVQAQSLDLERLQEAYVRAKGELISYKNLNSQPGAIMESWKECQKLFEELKLQYTNDKTKISNELVDIKQKHSELETKYGISKEENINMKNEYEKQIKNVEELNEKITILKKSTQKLKESRDRLKARLRIALQWAQKLDESRQKMKNTWDELKQLEAIVRHKESQIKGLHKRHLEDISKLEKKLTQRDETIRNILKDKTKGNI